MSFNHCRREQRRVPQPPRTQELTVEWTINSQVLVRSLASSDRFMSQRRVYCGEWGQAGQCLGQAQNRDGLELSHWGVQRQPRALLHSGNRKLRLFLCLGKGKTRAPGLALGPVPDQCH